MDLYQRALQLQPQALAHRRYLHEHAEVGLSMPKATAYITEQLKAIGLDPQPCGHGITATIGSGRPCILLRADMDALPMAEDSGEAFACPTDQAAHTCGHDLHAAMLLTAATMLQEQDHTLQGTVKLMFQPAEESLQGAADMIAQGLLENPAVDCALAFHVAAGNTPPGLYMYNSQEAMMASSDNFRITVHGKASHGAYPQEAISAIRIAAHLCLALGSLPAAETDPRKMCILTFGQLHSGSALNIIPDVAVLEGSIRCNDEHARQHLLQRVREVTDLSAKSFGGSAELEILSDAPPLRCDPALTERMAEFIRQLDIPGMTPFPHMAANASEDFARVAAAVPGSFFYLSAGFADERGRYLAHNPKVRFNEEVLPIGAACYAHCAIQWLANQ